MNDQELEQAVEELMRRSHETASASGFHEDLADDEQLRSRHVGSWLMLIVSELAEALEEMRNGHPLDEVYYNPEKPHKPEGFAVELADALIRIFDSAAAGGVPLAEALLMKMEYNKTREYRHGKTI